MKTALRKNGAKIIAFVLSFVLIFSSAFVISVTADSSLYNNAYERIMAEDGFVYGIVVPWNSSEGYATDIGGGQMDWNKNTTFSLDRWTQIFTNCKAIGFNAVRIWLFEQGEGIVFDATGDVTGVQEVFMTNLKTILDLAVSIGINLEVTFQAHTSIAIYPTSADLYNKFTQLQFDETKRQHYIDRVVTPVCNLLKDYKQNLVALNIFAEPEGDVSGLLGNNFQPYGTTWENMANHIRQVGAKMRELVPNVPLTASSGWNGFENLRRGKYNDLNLDIIGMDIYNDYGDVFYDTSNTKKYQSLKDLHLTKPAWVSEFGAISSKNWSNDFQSQSTIEMYRSAKEAGYTGAFYWMYGYPESSESLTMIGSNGNFRPVASAIKFMISDNKKEQTGDTSTLDTPTMIYNHDALNIRWFGSRNASKYKLERSTDKTNWVVVDDNIDPVTVDDSSYICAYQDKTVEFKTDYYYRVTVYDDENNSLVSEPSTWAQMKKLTCTPEENAIQNIGFENETFAPYVIYGNDDMSRHGFTTEDKNEGNKALYINGDGSWTLGAYQTVTLEPNTEYTFTMYAKAMDHGSNNSAWNILTSAWGHIGPVKHFIYDGQWHYYTMDFTTSSDTTYLWYFGDGGGNFIIDDMYLFIK